MQNLEVFNKIRSDLTLLVEKNKGLVIQGLNDLATYNKIKEAKNEIRKAEIELEKLAKSEREGALTYQRGIIALEKELKSITNPLIEEYTDRIKEFDKLKARQERLVLLPSRINKLKEIEFSLREDEILDLDENGWATFYAKAKLDYLESKEQKRIQKEQDEKREEQRIENERIKKENDKLKEENDKIALENKKLADEAKIKKDKDDAETLRLNNLEKAKKEEQSNKKYIEFLKECGITSENKETFIINRLEVNEGVKITVYKKINSIIL